ARIPERMPSGTLSFASWRALYAATARSACAAPALAATPGGAAISTSAPLLATTNATTPASPAAPWFSRARPTATPIAKSSPRFEKMASPAAAMGATSRRSGCPRRSSNPATGSTAMGSMSARPSACVDSSQRSISASDRDSGTAPRARLAKELAHLFGGRALERAARERGAFARVACARDAFQGRDRRGRRGDLAEAEADEDRQRLEVGGERAADRGGLCVGGGGLRDAGKEAQHRGMQRVEPRGEP